MNFNTKQEYLDYRNKWKSEYKQLIIDSRKLKQEFKEVQRKFSKSPINWSPEYYQAWRDVENTRYARIKQRNKAQEMLEELKIAKKAAQQSYQSSRLIEA